VGGSRTPLSRRRLLKLGLLASAAGLLAGRVPLRVAAVATRSLLSGRPGGSGGDWGWQAAAATGRVLYRDVALADARSPTRRTHMSVLVRRGAIEWIRPRDSEQDPGPPDGLKIVDGRGKTIVPGMVDAHCHLTSPGGPHYLERFLDPPERLLRTAETNGDLARQSGTTWLRDVGSPTVIDPVDGRRRALALGIRDRWAGRADRPRVVAAGTWIAPPGVLLKGLAVVVRDSDELLAAALRQLRQGADLVKLYVQANGSTDSPWTAGEIGRVVDAVHARGARVTAHALHRRPAAAAVAGGVDAIEHGFRLDQETCAKMARRGTYLVSTLIVPRSWLAIGETTSGTFWSTRAGRRYARRTLERAEESVALAHRAGVRIAAGTDFGGGSPRAGKLAWEVESLVAAGLQPWQALGAATWRGGGLVGRSGAGRIKEGGPADFFLVRGDPYSDPAVLQDVWRLA
jgi:imidazolonepropionase-like amidohydrolase